MPWVHRVWTAMLIGSCGIGGGLAVGMAGDADPLSELLAIREQKLEETNASRYLKPKWVAAPDQESQPAFWGQKSNYPWKREIVTTVFWIGERPARNNPVPNNKSSWDAQWQRNYGGTDLPGDRIGFRPAGFIPRQNPFYVALPYNDIDRGGIKPEARKVIPWFKRGYKSNYQSVVKGRWIAIRAGGKICFAQWEDCGPYRTDHWQYVFGNERPSPNRNGGAGLDVSPSVKDYLGIGTTASTDWRFVEDWEVPRGPWTKYGENNPFSPQWAGSNRKENSLANR